MAHSRAERRWFRFVKGMRRLREDKQEHKPYGKETLQEVCNCFKPKNSKEYGVIFSRFADTPQRCSCYGCGNRRQYEGPTVQELRCNERDFHLFRRHPMELD
jgi:hypothetical protein